MDLKMLCDVCALDEPGCLTVSPQQRLPLCWLNVIRVENHHKHVGRIEAALALRVYNRLRKVSHNIRKQC